MKRIGILFSLLFIYSCNAPRAYYDYDEQVDFSHYQNYDLYPELKTGLSQLDEERLIESLNSALDEKGIMKSAAPDFFINIYSQEFREPTRNNIGVGIGGTGRNLGVGISGGIPLGGPETFLSLTFDIIDATHDELIWQAVVEQKFDKDASPKKRKVIFDRMVDKALGGYPPVK